MQKGADYLGKHMLPIKSVKYERKHFKRPIFLFDQDTRDSDFIHLDQIVNIYEHGIYDFKFNALNIINHYKKHVGDGTSTMFTLGQSITFRMYEGQAPMHLPLFKFFVNYIMVPMLICMGADMTDWRPWVPDYFDNDAWCSKMNDYIRQCRWLGNMREVCEYLEFTKFWSNRFTEEVGDRLGHSISNDEFIEVTRRSKEAKESITCKYKIPEDVTPPQLEDLIDKRTSSLMKIIEAQRDLSISLYVRNGLFNPKQFREFAVHIGLKPDLNGNTIPYTYPTNILMGTQDIRAHELDARGGRKAENIKLKVSDAGTLERALCMLMEPVRFVDVNYECDSKHYRNRTIRSQSDLIKLDGRVATFDPKSDEYFVIDPEHDPFHLIGKTVHLKTPITCTHPRRHEGYICQACYGLLLANLNNDVHVGRISALNCADDMEQGLLSAKHALSTDTKEFVFGEDFFQFFEYGQCRIWFNDKMINASRNDTAEFNNLYLEFHLAAVKGDKETKIMEKTKAGENRNFDRSTPEIIVYNALTDTRVVIQEESDAPIFLHPDLNEYFVEYARHAEYDIQIPFTDLIDSGKPTCDVLFEYNYKNSELADALMTISEILNKGNNGGIDRYSTYEECLDELIPLFVKGGIKLPEIHFEMIISQLIWSDGERVDWNEDNPEYMFCSINKSVLSNNSVVSGISYREANKQIKGAHGTYAKNGTSGYDYFLAEDPIRDDED